MWKTKSSVIPVSTLSKLLKTSLHLDFARDQFQLAYWRDACFLVLNIKAVIKSKWCLELEGITFFKIRNPTESLIVYQFPEDSVSSNMCIMLAHILLLFWELTFFCHRLC